MYLLADWYAVALNPCIRSEDALRPRSNAERGSRSGVKEDAARPRVDTVRVGGKLRNVKRPACFSVADRRVSKLRPWLCVSYAAGMSNRSGRKTHSDRLGEDEAQKTLHPQSPAGEAINSNSPDGARREKRSTPIAGRVPSGRRTYVKLQPPDVDRGRRTYVKLRRFGPCCLRRATSNPQRQHSLVSDRMESESSLRSDPGNRDRAPRFLWSETLVESQTVQPLLPDPELDVKAFGQSTPRSFTKLHGSSLADGGAQPAGLFPQNSEGQ